MRLFGGDESALPGLDRVVRWSKALYRRWRRAREQSCVRCGSRAAQTCEACGALVCDRCWILSIETGAASALCLDCVASSTSSRAKATGRVEGAEIFRSGLRLLGAMIVAIAALSYWQRGWSGPRGVLLALLQPAVTFGLVPLAFLLGAIRLWVLRLVAALARSSAGRSASAGEDGRNL